MVNSRNIQVLIVALTAATGCSVSDTPIPPMDIGGGSVIGTAPSSGGSDYAMSSGQTSTNDYSSQVAYSRADPAVSRVRLPPEPVGNSSGMSSTQRAGGVDYADGNDVSYDERNRGGTQTLEAQAANLAPPPAPVAQVQPLPPVETPAPQTAAISSSPRIALAEVSGVGVNAAEPLATRFGTRARENGLSFTTADDASSTHVMKGYFNVTDQNGQAMVDYVWEIADKNGNRLHQIRGNEPGGGQGSGWDGVTPSAMQAIADRSIDETLRFLNSQTS